MRQNGECFLVDIVTLPRCWKKSSNPYIAIGKEARTPAQETASLTITIAHAPRAHTTPHLTYTGDLPYILLPKPKSLGVTTKVVKKKRSSQHCCSSPCLCFLGSKLWQDGTLQELKSTQTSSLAPSPSGPGATLGLTYG